MTSVLVLGGARSGKSAFAERLAAATPDVRYVAPGPVPDGSDPDWAARIATHRARRPASWTTLETGDVPGAIAAAPPGTLVLVDCLGTWATRVIDDATAWEDRDRAHAALTEQTGRLIAALGAAAADVVLVSNETGLGVIPATAGGRLFRDALGRLNTATADIADHVYLVAAGRVLDLSAAPRLTRAPLPWGAR